MPLLPRHYWIASCISLQLLGLSATSHAAVNSLTARQCLLMHQQNTIAADNPLPCHRLAQVSFAYIGFDGQRHHDGQMIVMDVLADQVQEIFDELLARRFPLQQARPMEEFNGDDQASMQANNSSSFNGRAMTGGSQWSKHAYGAAIDINPQQNPYLSHGTYLPGNASDYLKREPLRPGMAEEVKDIFYRHGFLVWGGNWHEPIDYQHFEIGSRSLIQQLLKLPLADARAKFTAYRSRYLACLKLSSSGNDAAQRDRCAHDNRL